MLDYVYGSVVAGSPLVLGEIFALFLGLKREFARKLIHVFGALTSASLVLFMAQKQIAVLGCLFFLVLLLIRRYHLITALYGVKRNTYGEVFFPIGVALTALVATSTTEYVTALLILGVSDTLASFSHVLGGSRFSYTLPNGKTVWGSVLFLVSSFAISIITGHSLLFGLELSMATTVAEAFFSKGFDNISIPLVYAAIAGALL